MRTTDKLGIIAALAAVLFFAVFYLSGSIGGLIENLAFVVDTVVAALLIAGAGLILEPRIAERVKNQPQLIDDLQNPEVKDRIRRERKKDVMALVSSEDKQKALNQFPRVRTLIEGLTLMDERDADIRRKDTLYDIGFDMMAMGGYANDADILLAKGIVENLASAAIEIMTVHKGEKMLRPLKPVGAEVSDKEREYRDIFPSAFHIYDSLPQKMTRDEAISNLLTLRRKVAQEGLRAAFRAIDMPGAKRSRVSDKAHELSLEVESYFEGQLKKRTQRSGG